MLVSNTGKTAGGANTISSSFSFAQAFDTGSNAGGYNLHSIVVSLVAPTGSGTVTATVRADDSGNPSSTVLYTLTNPTLGHGSNEFTAPANATLDAGKTYHVVLAFSESTGGPRWVRTAISQGLDAGASPGWDIDSGALRYSATQTTWSVVSSSQSFQLQVKGSLPATIPDAPTGLMANPEDTQVTLNWTVGADGGSAIITHRIRWKEGSGFYTGWQDIPNSAPSETNATSYTVTGLTNGTAYTFQVRAENGEGESIAPHATSSQVTPSATDTTAPTVTSIERNTPTTTPTNADALTWRVTFNEDVKDVGGADFGIAGTTETLTLSASAVSGSASQYDVTVSGAALADLDATLTLSFASGQDIKDIANNNLTDTAPTGTNDFTFVVDNTAPTVTSIERESPTTSPTNANSLRWLVTFSEPLLSTTVNDADFTVTGTTANPARLRISPDVYRVQVSSRNTNDLGDLNDTVTLTFATGQNITDPAGNALVNVTPTSGKNDNFFVVDNTAPTVTSIERRTPTTSPTNANSLQWLVTFSEALPFTSPGPGADDFVVSGTTVSLFVQPRSSTEFTVNVAGGDLDDLNDTVTLTFATGQNITDPAGNALVNVTPTSGTNDNFFLLDNTAPTVTITAASTSTGPFTATFTFDEAVTGFAVGDITVGNGAPSNLQNPTSDNQTFTALITPVATGTVTLNVAANVAMDAVGNGNTAAIQVSISHTASVADTTAPTVTSIVRQDPATSPTNANTLKWRVTFNENVKDIGDADFAITGTTASLGVVPMTGSTRIYDVTASGGNLAGLTGTVTLSFATGQDIKDNADNNLTNTTPTVTDESDYVVDNTAPTVTSIERVTPTTSPTNANSLTWRVTFSEDVQNVSPADFTVTGTTAGSSGFPVSNDVYQVEVSGGNLADRNGTVTLGFASNQDITDPAGNDLVTSGTPVPNDNTYEVDNAAPTVTITAASTSTGPFTATFTFDEAVTGFAVGDITVGNGAPSAFMGANGDMTYTATITPAANGEVTLNVAADVATDLASNGNTAAIQVSSTYMAPVIATLPDAPTGLMANPEDTQVTLNWTVGADGGSAIITHRIRWKEGSGFYTGWQDIPNSAPSETNATSYTVTGLTNGTAYTFQVRAENGEGESIAPHATSSQVTPSATDTTAPTVTSIVRNTPTTTPTNANTLTWRVTFNEDVKDVGYADFAIAGTTETLTLSVSAVLGSASSQYDVTVSGAALADLDATVTLSFASGQDIKDIANNALANTTPTGTNDNTYVVDNTAPTVTITAASTSTGPFTATFTFDEAVTGFAVGDITVGNGAPSNLLNPTSDNRTFTATITPVSSGDVTLNVAANAAEDAAGNGNTAATQVSSAYMAPGTPPPPPPPDPEPGPPENLEAAAGGGAVTLGWEAPVDPGASAIVRYEVRHAEGNSVPENTAWQSVGLNLSHTITGLTNGQVYAFEVRAVNSSNPAEGPAARVQATPSESPLVSLTPGRLLVAEDVGTIVLTVSLNRPAPSALSVLWYTQDEHAEAPSDYTAREGSLTFAAEESQKDISVPIVDDAVREDPVGGVHETFFVILREGQGYSRGDSYALVEIVDNDGDAPGDVTPPRLLQRTVNGTTLVLTYDETLDDASVPAVGDFVVQSGGNTINVSQVSVDGSKVTLTLAAPVQPNQAVSLDYTPGANPIQDASGNDAAPLSGTDVTPPQLTRAAVNAGTLVLTYNETLDDASVPAPGDFVVTAAGSTAGVDGVRVGGSAVTLTLAAPVQANQAVTLDYTPGANPTQDMAGNDAAALSGRAVTNNTPGSGEGSGGGEAEAVAGTPRCRAGPRR